MRRHRIVRVPASTANLGAGYDALGAALSPVLELEVEETGAFSIQAEGLDVPADRSNLCVRAFEALRPADQISFRIRSEIPVGAGLGSSAAAIVAGLMAADHLYEMALERGDLLGFAGRLEGHTDNVAAALHGGFVVCPPGDGAVTRLDPPQGIEAVLVVPPEAVATKQARKAIPAKIPHADAVGNVAAATKLVLGIERSDPSLITAGLAPDAERLHQPHRTKLYPRSIELVEQATSLGALGASISGAGPTVLVWSFWQSTGDVVGALRERVADWAEVRRVPFSAMGADVPEL